MTAAPTRYAGGAPVAPQSEENNPTITLSDGPANIDRPGKPAPVDVAPTQDEFTMGEADLVERILARTRESDTERRIPDNRNITRLDEWERSGRRFMGDHWSSLTNNQWYRQSQTITVGGIEGAPLVNDNAGMDASNRRCVINRIQNGIISAVQSQTGQPPRTRITSTEATGKIIYFLNPQAGMALAELFQTNPTLAQQFGLTPDQLVNPDPNMPDDGPITPLTTKQAALLRKLTDQWADPTSGGMMPPVLAENDITKLDDALDARKAQQAFDAVYDASSGDFYTTENELYCNIYGHAPMLFQWDVQLNLPRYSNPHILHVYPDPMATRVEDMDYLIIDAVISADRAKSIWPDLAELIDNSSSVGARSSAEWLYSSTSRLTNFTRRMLTIRTMWERHQRVPMTVDEALKQGKCQKVNAQVYAKNDGSEYIGDAHEVTHTPAPPVPAMPDQASMDGSPLLDVSASPPEAAPPPPAPAPGCYTGLDHDDTSEPLTPLEERELLILPTGEQTAQGSPNWPHTIGIRQAQMIVEVNRIVENIRCPFADIPIAWNVNIPIPYSPYGQGEPVRSEDPQQIVNRIVTILHAHARYYQYPMEIWPQTLLDRMKKSGTQNWSRPGRVVGLPDEDWKALSAARATGMFAIPPPVPASLVNLLELMLKEVDRIAGNVGVMQGEPPSPDSSGTAIRELQSSAMGASGFKAKFSEWRSDRLAMLTLDAMTKWMPEQQWREILSELPWPIVKLMIERIKKKRWTIKTEIASGRGYNRQVTHQEALQQYMGGQPQRLISRREAMVKTDVEDPPAMERVIDRENQEMGLTQAPAPAQPGQPPANPSQSPAPVGAPPRPPQPAAA